MCGLTGFILERRPDYDARQILTGMTRSLTHRGPDDEGYHTRDSVFLGHRRLEIIDLAGGKQPMYNEDQSVVIVFNGEIYNFLELRQELIDKGHQFRTQSDTEVIVHLWEEEGRALAARLNGMFAFALYDSRTSELYLARDRMGQKPMYWSSTAEAMVFGSELKSVMMHPAVKSELDPLSVSKYLLFDCVPSPHSMVRNVHKLEPGTWLSYKDGQYTVGRYWDMMFPDRRAKAPSMQQAQEQFVELLTRSVKDRLLSDVPLGVFLSGGIDSSAVTALMCDVVDPAQVKTFSVGFSDPSFDESGYASQVASLFGTTHFAQQLDVQTMLDVLPAIIARLDEPLADNSLIPTYFLSKFARERVTVALGGDGGDELCLGYPTFQAHKMARWFGLLPRFVRGAVGQVASTLPVSTSNISFDYKAKQFMRGMDYDRYSRHFVWIGSIPPADQTALLCPDFQPDSAGQVLEDVHRHASACNPRDDLDLLSYLYSKIYMCDDILTKVDRASMMNSLEVRAPILDHRVVEFLASLPGRYKLRGMTMKYVMKRALESKLPAEILHRKKKGFGIPVAEWLKGELRPWVEQLLSPAAVAAQGVFEPSEVQRIWNEHLAGVRDNRKPLWSLVVLMLWIKENL